MAFKTVDDFLNHRGSEGGGAKRLKSWAKDQGFLNIWLHTSQLPTAIWFHRVPELVVRKDKDDPDKTLRNIWGRQFACWEDESILKKQRFRTGDGHREHPPKKCGICRLTEAVREMIVSGEIKDTDVLFEFKGSDKPDEDVVLRAGALCNIWKRDIAKEEVERLNAAGVFMKNAWRENMVAKLNYIFAVVVHDAVGDGIQIAIQTQLVGDKVKKCINDEIARKDGDKGNPFLNPYCIQLLYKPAEAKFDDKYHARAVEKAISPEIERLIKSEQPDLSKFTELCNQKTLRLQLESRATAIGKKLPWDSIFDVPQLVPNAEPDPAEVAENAKRMERALTGAPGPKTPVDLDRKPDANAKPGAGDVLGEPCSEKGCEASMKAGATKCWKCGTQYEDDGQQLATAPGATPSDAALYDDQDVPF